MVDKRVERTLGEGLHTHDLARIVGSKSIGMKEFGREVIARLI